ncbi:acyl-CoA dehydrogenase [Stenotrophomonas panacihumi]|uniref:3-methylmercaptopropionyl-CoA dehydrogenase n=1 Tax=Stenotrophomonas panacihumi TaxID=676599 RepID=A0A0R0ANQ4_9GAMM|nr:acyl-CoA dehydrogenase C-terminal domain-containing protein [Stenotrophomonas panacihumi]KRG46329.1 acyl-CoA dehydrogenase [Stenotrophomonas panacihumi]PTN54709.1 acyl-CoA dehydrogenase [Stenotrophomonas panacihumi]
MSSYTAPVADIRFALHDVLGVEALFQRLGLSEATADIIDAVLEEAARFSGTVLAPLNSVGDEIGSVFDKSTAAVTTPPGFKQAYDQFVEGGWTGLTAAPEFGGQGLPHTLGVPLNEMVNAANLAWGNFPLLSHGAVEALKHHGEAWQQEVFLKPLIEGRWTGTMCLTEPHCGTDLGLLKTRAEPNADGSYSITGTKIFITAGEHDLTDNIVHLVLAKLPDAPPGPKGISLFVTPKFKVARDGTVGERNALACGSIEHKMGIKASVTCVMNFDGAQGYLVGQPHKGLQAMFTMMNTARLGVGLQGIGLSERAYQNALRYSRERLQSRSLSGAKFPDKPADPIIVQPDVRRMLLTIKSLTEGSRLLALHAATLIDVAHHAQDPAERERADTLVSFLTPISKACQTEWGIENTYHALQCFGGHGYIHEHGMEQLARDARITTLYEGTTGIQALDLMGRKTAASQAAGLKLFLAEIEAFAREHEGDADLAEFIKPLRDQASEWAMLTREVLERAARDPEEIGAASYDYLFYSGYVVLAYWWARSVAAARGKDTNLATAKRETARFYYARILPRTMAHAAHIRSGAKALMALDEALFG